MAARLRALLPPFVRRAGRALLSPRSRRNWIEGARRRLAGEPALPAGPVRSVLVVCAGNLCRSPFAATLLAAQCPDLTVRSAGLSTRDGSPAEPAAIEAGRRRGTPLDGHRARQVSESDVRAADLVLGMEGWHIAELAARFGAPRFRVRLLGDFLAEPPFALPDPYGQPDAVFDVVFGRIAAAVDRLGTLLGGRR
jgi:protein-tyrosine phosphatase